LTDPNLRGLDTDPRYLDGPQSFDGEVASNLDQHDAEALSAQTEHPQSQSVTAEDLQRTINSAKKIYDYLGADVPRGPGENATAQEQQAYAVSALGLSLEEVAKHGELGSTEAMAYILAAADQVIEQLGVDPEFIDGATPEQLSQALREKTEEEIETLAQALYIRGMMGSLSMRDKAIDPLTGKEYEIGDVSASGGVNTAKAGYERGRASDIEALSGMRGASAREFLDSLLAREVDPWQMQARQDAALELAKRTEGDPRRRRAGESWDSLLDQLSPEQVNALLRALGQ
jgi:hypothetical protein